MSDNEKTQNNYSIKKNTEEKTITLTKLQNEDCISVTNLKKQYVKDSAYTLDGISFNVKYGTVFGFLGPNGAGKTTTLKIITALLSPSSGGVYIFGKDLDKYQLEIKRRIGVVSQNPSFEANLTVERALDLYGMLWGLHDRKLRREKVNKILETFDLESIRNAKNDELSIGQRRRVQVAREFMHDMDLLFLDEPTVGLDPSARRQLLDYIKTHVRSGLTVFFTTHIMEEAEYLCDEIAIIDKGKIIAFDTPTGLIQKCGGGSKTIEIIFKDILNKSFFDLLKSTISKNNSDNNSIISDGKHTVTISVTNTEQVISEILQHVSKYGLQIENITINPPSLEEVFLSIVKNHDSTSEVRK
jgi:ABC-2 type transport system ATP-binding protein